MTAYPILKTLTKDSINFQPLKGPPLAIFLAVALHTNRNRWTWPSHKLLSRETGYSIHTVSRTISNLCKLEINGKRLLLHCQPTEIGTSKSNHYLIFPSQAEIDQYE
jgi:hypothetical protein